MFMLLALLLSSSPIIFKISAVSHCDKNIVLMLRGILGLAKNLVKSWFITAESLFISVEEAILVFRFLGIDEKKVLKPSAISRLSVTRLPSTINDALSLLLDFPLSSFISSQVFFMLPEDKLNFLL